ncbi:uncharacterized protein B0T15DRAFT_100266 [Chaetomium strumarium]|uniref:Uncharacterized protein n=1 Tax=Chaetomium strumarium TaxID=1170767 RepID=A0AAJ0M479_9PEZI|nr:hypothetical protein B0T15DRAFT_100266 [Chaetomium strumarium]
MLFDGRPENVWTRSVIGLILPIVVVAGSLVSDLRYRFRAQLKRVNKQLHVTDGKDSLSGTGGGSKVFPSRELAGPIQAGHRMPLRRPPPSPTLSLEAASSYLEDHVEKDGSQSGWRKGDPVFPFPRRHRQRASWVSDGSMEEGWLRVRPCPQRPPKERRAVLES